MSKFRFRLQPVLNLKTQEKNTSFELYGKAQNSLRRRRDDLQGLTDKKESYLVQMETEKGETIDTVGRRAEWNFLKYLHQEIETVNADVNHLQEQVQIRHRHLLDKLKEEKSLEKLKEIQKTNHDEEVGRARQKELDEIAQQQFLQRQKEGRP